jgi:hypothetical protein
MRKDEDEAFGEEMGRANVGRGLSAERVCPHDADPNESAEA